MRKIGETVSFNDPVNDWDVEVTAGVWGPDETEPMINIETLGVESYAGLSVKVLRDILAWYDNRDTVPMPAMIECQNCGLNHEDGDCKVWSGA